MRNSLTDDVEVIGVVYDPAMAPDRKPLRTLMTEFDREFAGDPERREVAGELVLYGVGQGLSTTEAFAIGSRLARQVVIVPRGDGHDDPASRSAAIEEIAKSRGQR